jgi:hypothetical protein
VDHAAARRARPGARGAAPPGFGALDTDLFIQLRALVERGARVETLTPEERRAVADRNINVNIPLR